MCGAIGVIPQLNIVFPSPSPRSRKRQDGSSGAGPFLWVKCENLGALARIGQDRRLTRIGAIGNDKSPSVMGYSNRTSGLLQPRLTDSNFAGEKRNWGSLIPSVCQQALKRFCLSHEFLGAEFGQLAEVVQLPANARQLGKMGNPHETPVRLVADK